MDDNVFPYSVPSFCLFYVCLQIRSKVRIHNFSATSILKYGNNTIGVP